MKYLFSLLFIFVLGFSAQSQKIYTFTGSDTIVNTASVDMTLTVSGSYDAGVIQVINTKLSGTGAGTSILKGSIDGTNYVNLDTITHTNVAVSTGVFELVLPKYAYYKVTSTGSGTMSVITTSKAHFKKLKL